MTDLRTEEVKKELHHKRAKSIINKIIGTLIMLIGCGMQALPYIIALVYPTIQVPKALTDQWYVPMLVVAFGLIVYLNPKKVVDSASSLLDWIKKK